MCARQCGLWLTDLPIATAPGPCTHERRREKNRQAARKCRNKKICTSHETEQRLNELKAANRSLKQELSAWQARLKRERQLIEALKVCVSCVRVCE